MADRTLEFDFSVYKPAEEAPAPKPSAPEEPRALSVAELDRAVKGALETCFDLALWVEGEVTGMRAASSGHLYFCLKDEREDASIDVAMYKPNITPRARALLVDGARVRIRGKPTFWAPRGRLQFICDRAQAVGKGALLEALQKLKTKLGAEGLFAAERKRPLPREPRRVGVVTSAGGAVIHDICKVAFRRGGARVLLAPARVQGAGAAETILRALDALARVSDVDVIILGRGGGSSDDLQCFNDEALVRAVASCRVPVVSAVGHEVDVTLCDFAADARAATPSQAAEMVVPDARERRALLGERHGRLLRAMRARITENKMALGQVAAKLGDPRLAIASQQQRLDDRTARLEASLARALHVERDRLAKLRGRLGAVHPSTVIARERAALGRVSDRMVGVLRTSLARRTSSIEGLAGRLDAMSPLKVLARGYAIATREDGRAVRAASDVSPGQRIAVRVESAVIDAEVTATHDAKETP